MKLTLEVHTVQECPRRNGINEPDYPNPHVSERKAIEAGLYYAGASWDGLQGPLHKTIAAGDRMVQVKCYATRNEYGDPVVFGVEFDFGRFILWLMTPEGVVVRA